MKGSISMQFVNRYLRSLRPYPLASHKIWTVSCEDRQEMLKLDWNEGTVPPSPRVAQRVLELAQQADFYNIYPSTNNDELSDLLAAYVGLPREHMLYFSGSDVVHECIARVFIGAGDPVLMLGPTYDNFRLTAEASGARVSIFEVNDDFTFNPKKFEAAIDALHPSFIYICSPNNPTGYRHSPDYIKYLLTRYADSMFLLDEAYYEFSGITVKDLVLTHENIIVTRTMSKAFSIANFRFGYAISATKNIASLSVVRNPKNIPTFTQAAATGVLEDTQYMWDYVALVREARDEFYSNLVALGDKYLKPYYGYGNFILVKCVSPEFCKSLIAHLNANNIFVRAMYQSPMLASCVRISIGTKKQMARVLRVMKEYLAMQ